MALVGIVRRTPAEVDTFIVGQHELDRFRSPSERERERERERESNQSTGKCQQQDSNTSFRIILYSILLPG